MQMLSGLTLMIWVNLLAIPTIAFGDPVPLRIGVLAFGTVNWTLKAREHLFPPPTTYAITLTPFAGGDAALIALQGRAVDLVVNDWLWVARQRSQGGRWRFYPYSKATGTLLVRDTDVTALPQLVGQTLGVAGGPFDKSWLFLRAYGLSQGIDLQRETTVQFVSPPLLNQIALQGQVQATLNFWHFSARLEAAGFRPLIRMNEVLSGLGIDGDLPLVGWVFDETFAHQNAQGLNDFLRDMQQASVALREASPLWDEVRSLMQAEDDATFLALQAGYRAGVLPQFGEAERGRAEQAFTLLRELGGERLLGTAAKHGLDTALFWELD